MKVFISGPMTGYPNYNKDAFIMAEDLLNKCGYEAFNPATLPEGWTDQQYLGRDMIELTRCDAIAMLPNWEQSKGAIAEYYSAWRLGLELLFIEMAPLTDGFCIKSHKYKHPAVCLGTETSSGGGVYDRENECVIPIDETDDFGDDCDDEYEMRPAMTAQGVLSAIEDALEYLSSEDTIEHFTYEFARRVIYYFSSQYSGVGNDD